MCVASAMVTQWPAVLDPSDPIPSCPVNNNKLNLSNPDCTWAADYDEARQKFLLATTKHASSVESLQVGEGLFVDVAVFKGRSDQLVLHLAGIHGVEAYVGSAIQISMAPLLANLTLEQQQQPPTVILVHALNPFGMKYSRRTNENNVDLNRNTLFSEKDEAYRSRDPNIAGYETFNPVFNPSGPPNWPGFLIWVAELVTSLIKHGFGSFRQALITGSYTRSKGIYYGGSKLENSHIVLRDFLQRRGYLQSVKQLILIDVHSGLGKYGRDTIMVDSGFKHDYLFNSARNAPDFLHWSPPVEIERLDGSTKGSDATVGYALTVGVSTDGYPSLFKHPEFRCAAVAQEFGTVAPIIVAWTSIHENQAWQYGSDADRASMGKRLKRVFSPSSKSFLYSILPRGQIVLFQAIKGINEV